MTDSMVQVPPDSTGKKVQTFEAVVGANTVEAQATVEVDPTTLAAINPAKDSTLVLTNTALSTLTAAAGGVATADPPALVDGSASGPSLDLAGNTRVADRRTDENANVMQAMLWESRKQTALLILLCRSFGHSVNQDDINALTEE